MPILDEAMHRELVAELVEQERQEAQRMLLVERALERAKALETARTIAASQGERIEPQDTAKLLRELAEELKSATGRLSPTSSLEGPPH